MRSLSGFSTMSCRRKRLHPVILLFFVLLSTLFNLVELKPTQANYGEKRSQQYQQEMQMCAYKNGSSSMLSSFGVIHRDPILDADLLIDSDDGTQWVKNCKFCYTLWNEKHNQDGTNQIVIIGQGCWLPSSGGCSSSSCTMDSSPNAALNKLAFKGQKQPAKFCCCTGHKCNVNVKNTYENKVIEYDYQYDVSSDSGISGRIVLLVVSAVVGCLVCLCSCIIYICRRKTLIVKSESHCDGDQNTMELESKSPLLQNRNQLDLTKIRVDFHLGQGQFSTLLRCTLNEGNNATKHLVVKAFGNGQRKCFLNEKATYEIRHLNNAKSLMEYYGAFDEVTLDGVHYASILVLSYAERGSLSAYLKHHTLNWDELRRILLSISQAIAHLHADGISKASVCHRNLSSHHVVVGQDLTCRLCDFTLATHESDDQKVNRDIVGNVRYMAPELLEGALNLRDWKSSLKQTDMYALGLVFWEVTSRCKDFYQGTEIPQFSLAFEREIGHNPTLDQMQILVSRNKSRPLFPSVWKDSNPAMQLLRETIEYSWDQDGEARLTSLCVVERIRELEALWVRFQSKRSRKTNNANNHREQTQLQTSNKRNNNPVVRNDISNSQSSPCSPVHRGATSSWLTKTSPTKNDNVVSKQKAMVRLQPFQGRNPCKERNLNIVQNEEKQQTSPLICKSLKHPDQTFRRNISEPDMANLDSGHAPFSPATPINYLQNDLGKARKKNSNQDHDHKTSLSV